MVLKYQKMEQTNKLLRLFYENSDKEFTVRGISKLTKIPKSTVHRYLKELREENLITDNNKALNDYRFKIKKISYYIEVIVNSGLISSPSEVYFAGIFSRVLNDSLSTFIKLINKNPIKTYGENKKLRSKK